MAGEGMEKECVQETERDRKRDGLRQGWQGDRAAPQRSRAFISVAWVEQIGIGSWLVALVVAADH
jgi:hypothetical protein